VSQKNPLERYEFRKVRTRLKLFGTAERPRLTVRRSSKHIYAQLVDDAEGKTLVYASSLEADLRAGKKNGAAIPAAKAVGKALGEKAKAKKIVRAVFDRGGRPYHGRIKALADGAREAGMQF
jgi:large subunit ribosomal protein L18